jgi:Lanthionine synthetase C-like protein
VTARGGERSSSRPPPRASHRAAFARSRIPVRITPSPNEPTDTIALSNDTTATIPHPARTALFDGADAERALAAAEEIFARAFAWNVEHPSGPPESNGAFGGCVLVANALARAGRSLPVPLPDVVRRAMVTAPDRRSLYEGKAGLLATLDAIDPQATSFARPRAALREAVAADILSTAELDPLERATFDVILGMAGKVAALHDPPQDVRDHVRALFFAFADRIEERLGDREEPVDLGVAHGFPGLLAALNVSLPGERALARRYTELIVRTSHAAGGVRRWGGACDDRFPPPRRAWCYQTVGVASVLYDRARIDGDDALRALALDALEGTLDEPDTPHWDDALCHGRSGAALLYARVEDRACFAREAERLAHAVLDGYRAELPFGYRAYNLRDGAEEDRPQFLDGALGIAMFLIDAARPSQRHWLRLLGLLP